MSQELVLQTHLYVGNTRNSGAIATEWTEIGIVTDFNIEPVSEKHEVWEPSPGLLELKDVIEFKKGFNFSGTIEGVGPLFWELLFGTTPLTAGSGVSWEANSRTATAKCWIKFTQYSPEGASGGDLVNTGYCWAALEVTATGFGSKSITYTLNGRRLKNANTTDGTLATLA